MLKGKGGSSGINGMINRIFEGVGGCTSPYTFKNSAISRQKRKSRKGLLTPLERDFLKLFSQLPDQENFFLAGGTALAEFYLGHRLSYDLDMFTNERDLILPFSHELERICQVYGIEVKVVRRFAAFVELLIQRNDETLRLDLGLDSPYPVTPPMVSEYGVQVNSFEDMKADKLFQN